MDGQWKGKKGKGGLGRSGHIFVKVSPGARDKCKDKRRRKRKGGKRRKEGLAEWEIGKGGIIREEVGTEGERRRALTGDRLKRGISIEARESQFSSRRNGGLGALDNV